MSDGGSVCSTKRAMAHIAVRRREDPDRPATWSDVSEAFDAGMKYAVDHRLESRRELIESGRNSPPKDEDEDDV